MRFALTEEQQLIQGSALDWLSANYDFRQRASGLHRDGGAPAVWQAFAAMGWLGLPLSEDLGGSGGGPVEAGLLMHAFGRHLVVEPFHGTVLLAAQVVALAGSPAQQRRWLAGVVAGEHRLALAHGEPQDALPFAPRCTRARRSGRHWELDGRKQLVCGAAGAARWVVSARTDDDTLRLFLVDPAQPGIGIDPYDTPDGGRAADLVFDAVLLDEDAMLQGGVSADDARPVLDRVLGEGIVARCWEAAGVMQALLEQTASYTAQRRQFGQAISGFQVVQHRLAEMAVQCTETHAACELAAMRLAREPECAVDMAAMARSKVARASRFVAQEAVQLHGAMGVCEELPVASAFRALLAFGHEGGDDSSHAARLGGSLLDSGEFARSQTLREPGQTMAAEGLSR